MSDFSDTDDEALLQASEALEKQGQLRIPDKFEFPFEPYEIQTRFMQGVYQALELGKIGIFESPTGTGKSLSLICGALTWLLDYERRQAEDVERALAAAAARERSVDWIAQYALQKKVEQSIQHVQVEHEQRVKTQKRLEAFKASSGAAASRKRHFLTDPSSACHSGFGSKSRDQRLPVSGGGAFSLDACNAASNEQVEVPDVNLLADYESGDEVNITEKDSDDDTQLGSTTENVHVTKIFYCSRTHSQLAQFVREVQKSPFGRKVKVASLGSRQTMCINKSVRQLASLSLINDRCLELREGQVKVPDDGSDRKKKKACGCPFYGLQGVSTLTDQMLVEVQDIEELVESGHQLRACPYYAARRGIAAAQLVVLPYNVLLHKSTRDSSGISLKGNVVIIDEAHNLLDAIGSMHRSSISHAQLQASQSHLQQYLDRYRKRLNAKNLFYVDMLLTILAKLVKCLSKSGDEGENGRGRGGGGRQPRSEQNKQPGSTSSESPTMSATHDSLLMPVNDFLFETGLDNVNFFKVLRYCQLSRLADKLLGFGMTRQPTEAATVGNVRQPSAGRSSRSCGSGGGMSALLSSLSGSGSSREGASAASDVTSSARPPEVSLSSKEEQDDEAAAAEPMQRSPLRVILNFLQVLTNANKDGRVVITREGRSTPSAHCSGTLQYLLLNPAAYFADVLDEARAVIVAGGTMQPVSDFKEHLFLACSSVRPERVVEFSCGHIMPPENLLALALAPSTPDGPIELTFHKRALKSSLDCIGQVVLQVCQVTPGGVVCFLPSYDYEALLHGHLESSGLLQSIATVKKIFREPKKASTVDHILAQYAKCIVEEADRSWPPSGRSITGALLLSVVGGKMSEGINFADDLGRCVIMVGLPYPNMQSPELKEKMKYLDAKSGSGALGRKSPGSVYYENLCMKAVNQSIGRAIRHKNDYAAIVLLDARYQRDTVVRQLPGWVSRCVRAEGSLAGTATALRQFFGCKSNSSAAGE